MEQYELAQDVVYGDIQYCLENYKVKRIFIRPAASSRGLKRVNENLENKTLNVEQTQEGLSILIDDSEVFVFRQEEMLGRLGEYWGKDFSIGYARDPDENARIPMLSTGIDPDDPNLPPVNTSSLRCANRDYFLQIFFEGKIPLKFHSWLEKPHWKYWCVDTEALGKSK